MKTRAQLLKSKSYWIAKLQLDLYDAMKKYMEQNKMNKTQLAAKLGVTKGYITQILSGDFDHKLSKLVELSLAIGKVPCIKYNDIEKYIQDDELGLLAIPEEERPNITLVIDLNETYTFSKTDDNSRTYKKEIKDGNTLYLRGENAVLNECVTE